MLELDGVGLILGWYFMWYFMWFSWFLGVGRTFTWRFSWEIHDVFFVFLWGPRFSKVGWTTPGEGDLHVFHRCLPPLCAYGCVWKGGYQKKLKLQCWKGKTVRMLTTHWVFGVHGTSTCSHFADFSHIHPHWFWLSMPWCQVRIQEELIEGWEGIQGTAKILYHWGILGF